MVITKDQPEYVNLDIPFHPLPKHGHLGALDPDFAKLKPATDALIETIWEPSLSLAAFRALWLHDSTPPENSPVEGVDVLTHTRRVPMRDGASVEVKVYAAKEKKKERADSALVMRFHGGGWVVGGHCTENAENVVIAGRTNSVVVSVDYRMAPEFRFPYAVNDCFDALKWSKENAASLGVDGEKIILAGGSAGGNLAAVVALMARDANLTGILAQLLCFPVTCHPKFAPVSAYELGSYRQNRDASVVTSARLEWFLDEYMPEPSDDWRLSCLLAPEVRGLPPALVIIAGYDPLRDEGLAYAERLDKEGVQTELVVYPGLPHCFYMFPTHPKTVDYYDRVVRFIRRFSEGV